MQISGGKDSSYPPRERSFGSKTSAGNKTFANSGTTEWLADRHIRKPHV